MEIDVFTETELILIDVVRSYVAVSIVANFAVLHTLRLTAMKNKNKNQKTHHASIVRLSQLAIIEHRKRT